MLRSLVGGSLLLPGIISELLATENQTLVLDNPLAPRAPHFPAKAKRVIFLYMSGGVSHIDSFDPKPKLVSDHGKKTKEGYIKRRLASLEEQQMELGLIQSLNRRHQRERRSSDPALAARIKSFETAFGMQMEAPEAFDLSKETDATHEMYGLLRGARFGFAWQCLVARRLA